MAIPSSFKSQISKARTLGCPDARTPGRSDVRTLGHPDARTSRRPGVRTPGRSDTCSPLFQFLRSSRRGPEAGPRRHEPGGAGPRRDERKNCEKRTKKNAKAELSFKKKRYLHRFMQTKWARFTHELQNDAKNIVRDAITAFPFFYRQEILSTQIRDRSGGRTLGRSDARMLGRSQYFEKELIRLR